jgi:hypothetical protein
MQFEIPQANEVLGAMITPAVLISASGTLILSTSNRLGRIVDRVRDLAAQAEKLKTPDGLTPDEVAEKAEQITDQLGPQFRRARLLQAALTVLYAAVGLLVAASLAIGASAAARGALRGVPIFLGLGGAVALLVASSVLVREARLAVKSTMIEMTHVRAAVARRTGKPDLQ